MIRLEDEVEKVYPALYFSENSRDPHIWLSPKRVMIMIDVIERELSSIDEENSSKYKENAQKYKKELERLDTQIQESIQGLQNKTIIVYHPSFGYFADDYGLEMIALEKDGKEATVERMTDIIDYAKENGIKVIFYQAEIDSKQSELFANEIDGEAIEIQPLTLDYIGNLQKIIKII